MTDLIPKPKRRMLQPTKDDLRATIKSKDAQLRIRGEQYRELHSAYLALQRHHLMIDAPPYTWWRHLLGLRHKPKDKS